MKSTHVIFGLLLALGLAHTPLAYAHICLEKTRESLEEGSTSELIGYDARSEAGKSRENKEVERDIRELEAIRNKALDKAITEIRHLQKVKSILEREYIGKEKDINLLMTFARNLIENFKDPEGRPIDIENITIGHPFFKLQAGPAGVAKSMLIQRWGALLGWGKAIHFVAIKSNEPMFPVEELKKIALYNNDAPKLPLSGLVVFEEAQNLWPLSKAQRLQELSKKAGEVRENPEGEIQSRLSSSEQKELEALQADRQKIDQRVDFLWNILDNGRVNGTRNIPGLLEDVGSYIVRLDAPLKRAEAARQEIQSLQKEIDAIRQRESEVPRELEERLEAAKNREEKAESKALSGQESLKEGIKEFLEFSPPIFSIELLAEVLRKKPESIDLFEKDGLKEKMTAEALAADVEINGLIRDQLAEYATKDPGEILRLFRRTYAMNPVQDLNYLRAGIVINLNPIGPLAKMKERLDNGPVDPDAIRKAAKSASEVLPDYLINEVFHMIPEAKRTGWISRLELGSQRMVEPMDNAQTHEAMRRGLEKLSFQFHRSLQEKGIDNVSLFFDVGIAELIFKNISYENQRNVFKEPERWLDPLIGQVKDAIYERYDQVGRKSSEISDLERLRISYDRSTDTFRVEALDSAGKPITDSKNIEVIRDLRYKSPNLNSEGAAREVRAKADREAAYVAARALIGMIVFGSVPQFLTRVVESGEAFIRQNWPSESLGSIVYLRRQATILVAGVVVEAMARQGIADGEGRKFLSDVDVDMARSVLLEIRQEILRKVERQKLGGNRAPSIEDVAGVTGDPVLNELFSNRPSRSVEASEKTEVDTKVVDEAMQILNRQVRDILEGNTKLLEKLAIDLAAIEAERVLKTEISAESLLQDVQKLMSNRHAKSLILKSEPGSINLPESTIVHPMQVSSSERRRGFLARFVDWLFRRNR